MAQRKGDRAVKTELLYSILGDISEEQVLAARRNLHPWLCAVAILLAAALTFGLSWVVDYVEAERLYTDGTVETLYLLPEDQSQAALSGFWNDFRRMEWRDPILDLTKIGVAVHRPDGRLHADASSAVPFTWQGRMESRAGTLLPVPAGGVWFHNDREDMVESYLAEGFGTDCMWFVFSRQLAPSTRSTIYRLARQHFGAGSQYFRYRTHQNRLAVLALLILIVFLFCGVIAMSYAAILRRRELLDRSPGKYALARADRVALRYAAWVTLGGLLGLIASGLTVVVLDAANILYAWLCPAALNGLLGCLLIRK